MASSYPTGLDSLLTNRANGQVIQASTDNDQADAINRIEAELGITPSGLNATVAERFDASRLVLNVKAEYGAKGDGKTVTDGAMTSGSAVLTSATAAFTAADVGKQISVTHATSVTLIFATTIASVTNSTTAALAAPATVAGTGRTLNIDGGRTVTDAVTTNNSTTITSATANFSAVDVGHHVTLSGSAAGALNTTITGYTSATQVTLAANATRTCSGEQVVFGTDDTAAFIAATEAARDNAAYATVYAPEGLYLLQPSISGGGGMQLYSRTQLLGDGWGTTLRKIGHPTNDHGSLVAINHWSAGSSDPSLNQREIVIRDIHLQGHVVEDGFMQWRFLLEANAVTDLVVEHVKFSRYQGDCIYLGSGTQTDTLERHNIGIRIANCLFDGVNRDNRNALSIIDGEDITVQRCVFRNCVRTDMPGCIDLEPNAGNSFSICKAIHVDSCYFDFCGGNSGHIGAAFHRGQNFLTVPFTGYTVTNNVFRRGLGGQRGMVFIQDQYPTETTERADITISHNQFVYGLYAIETAGVKGIDIHNNTFVDFWAGTTFGYQQKSLDVTLRDNYFVRCAWGQDGIHEIVHADRIEFDRNTYDNCGNSNLSGANLIKFVASGGGLGQPGIITATPFTTGGTLGAATRSYRLSSYGDNGETLATTAVTAVTTGTTARVDLAWTPDYNAAGTKVYGRTGGSELLIATLGAGVTSYSDTGAVTPAGALPGSNTSAQGASNGITFARNVARQGPSNRLTRVAVINSPHKTIAASLRYIDNVVPTSVGDNMGPFVDYSNRYKPTARVASTANVTLPPGGTTLTIDTVALSNGDRVLLKNQTAPAENGIYVVDGIGSSVILTRSGDTNTAQLVSSMLVFVDEGAENSDSGWTQTTPLPITMGTTALRFTRTHPAYQTGTVGSVTAAQGPFNPTGCLLENFSRYASTLANQAALTTQIIRVFPMGVLRAGKTFTAINYFSGTTAAVTITASWAGIARVSDRVVLARSANSTAALAANTLRTATFSATYTPDVDVPIFGFIMWQATTVPTLAGVAALNLINVSNPVINGNSNTGQGTTPIAVGATLTALTADTEIPYAFLT